MTTRPTRSHSASYPLLLSLLYGGDLLGDDRQHFDVDAIKFVETRPRAGTAVSRDKHLLARPSMNHTAVAPQKDGTPATTVAYRVLQQQLYQ